VSGTVIVYGDVALTDGSIAGSGAVEARANVTQASTYDGGLGNLWISGSGDQTFTGSATAIAGDLPNVTINKSAGTLTLAGTLRIVAANWTYVTGAVDPGTSTVIFTGVLTVTGSHTLTNVEFQGAGIKTVAAGTTLTAGGTLTLTDGDINTGTLAAQGDITQASTFDGETGTLLINGTGNQTFIGTAIAGVTDLTNVVINKPSGTLTLGGNIAILTANWTYLAGTIDPGASNLIFDSGVTITGSHTLNNVEFRGTGVKTIAAATTLTVVGTLTLTDGTINTGTVAAQGDAAVASTFDGGSSPLSFTGGANQVFTSSGGVNPTGTWTVNKSAGSVTLASDMDLTAAGQDLRIVFGVLDLGAYGLTVNNLLVIDGALVQGVGNLWAGGILIGATGAWTNESTGDITIGGGGVNNDGSLLLDGAGPGCGDTDEIQIRSSLPGAQQPWSGSGSTSLYDVDVQDQAGSAYLIVLSGTDSGNTGANWIIVSGCSMPTPTYTPTPTATDTPTPTPTWTPTYTSTSSSTPTNTSTSTPAPTNTSAPTTAATSTRTQTLTVTRTSTPTSLSTSTGTPTASFTPTSAPNLAATSTISPSPSSFPAGALYVTATQEHLPLPMATSTRLLGIGAWAASNPLVLFFGGLPCLLMLIGLIAGVLLAYFLRRKEARQAQ